MARVTWVRGDVIADSFELASGLTVNHAVKTLCPDNGDFTAPTIVMVGADVALRDEWDVALPEEAVVTCIELPQGSGGGGGGKNPMQMVMMVAVMVLAAAVSWYLGPTGPMVVGQIWSAGTGAVMGALGGAAVMMLGSMLAGALFANAAPKIPSGQMGAMDAAKASPTYNINSSGNQARLWQVIGKLFGRMKIVPDFVAKTYVEFAGNQQYGYFIYGFGRGACVKHQFQFGETPFWRDGEFLTESGYYQDADSLAVEFVEPGNPVTLFPDNVTTSSEVSGQTLFAPNDAEYHGVLGPYIANAPGTVTNRILIDLVFPQGIGTYNDQGGLQTYSISVLFEYRAVDDYGSPISGWQTFHSATYTNATLTAQRYTIPVDLPEGRYELRGKRTSNSTGDGRTMDTTLWQGLRALLPGTITYNQSVVAVKIRASNALTQSASTKFSAITTAILPLYDRKTKTWSEPVETRSWGAAVCDILKDPLGGDLKDYQIDLEAVWSIDEQLQGQSWYFDAFIDGAYTVSQILDEVCQSVGVIWRIVGGVISFVRDLPDRPTRFVFNPRNIVRGSFAPKFHTWSDSTPDDVSIEYLDAEHGFANWDVRAVLPESESRKPSQLKLIGITDRDHAFKLGVMFAARNRWRRIEVELQTENLGRLINRGDVCQVVHPRFKDTASGKLHDWNESELSVWLKKDTYKEFPAPGEQAYIAFVRPDGTAWGPCRLAEISSSGRALLDSADYSSLIVRGMDNPFEWFRLGNDGGIPTVWTLQDSQEFNRRMIVQSVIPQDFNHYTVRLVNDAPEIGNYDNLPTPPWGGRTQTNVVTELAAPTMLRGRGQDDGATLVLTWNPVPGAWFYEVEYSYDDTMWSSWGRSNVATFSHEVAAGRIYIRVRASTETVMSPWALWNGDSRMVQPAAPVVTAESYIDGAGTISWPVVMYQYGQDLLPDTDDDTPSPVTEYLVALASSNGGTPFFSETVTDDALQDGDTVSYTFQPEDQTGGPFRTIYASVFAINGAGMGDSGMATLTDPAPPAISWASGTVEIASNTITIGADVVVDPDPDTTGYVLSYGTSQKPVIGFQVISGLPFTVTGLDHGTTYMFSIAPKDSFYDDFGGNDSLNWSVVMPFTTLTDAPWNDTPVITSPTQNQSVEFSAAKIVFSPNMSAGNTAAKQQIQTSYTQDFVAILWDSGQQSYTNGTATLPVLNMLTNYYVRVRILDARGVVSGWSSPVRFKTNMYEIGTAQAFSASGSFAIPATGKWRITVVGGGGYGGASDPYDQAAAGAGGGSGGKHEQEHVLTYGQQFSFQVGGPGGNPSRCFLPWGGEIGAGGGGAGGGIEGARFVGAGGGGAGGGSYANGGSHYGKDINGASGGGTGAGGGGQGGSTYYDGDGNEYYSKVTGDNGGNGSYGGQGGRGTQGQRYEAGGTGGASPFAGYGRGADGCRSGADWCWERTGTATGGCVAFTYLGPQ